MVGGNPVHGRMFSSNPGLCPLGESGAPGPRLGHPRMSADIAKCLPGAKLSLSENPRFIHTYVGVLVYWGRPKRSHGLNDLTDLFSSHSSGGQKCEIRVSAELTKS